MEPIAVADREGALPASLAQQRLWFLAQLGVAGHAYHIHGGLRLKGALKRAALLGALDEIVQRHEVLRTTFRSSEGRALQVVDSSARMTLIEDDFSAGDDADERAHRLIRHEAGQPFDLGRGPLIRARLIRIRRHEHVLVVTMHHIISDAWSMGVMVAEIGAMYDAFSRGQGNPLPPLRFQYADYASWQVDRWQQGRLREQARYWQDTLNGAPSLLELPTDRPRPRIQNFAGASVAVELDAESTRQLKALSGRSGVTLFTALLAAWGILLARLSGQSTVLVGIPVANRMRKELEGMIGFFVNTLVLKVDVSAEQSVADVIEQTRARMLQAQSNADVPFEQVVELLKPVRSLAHSPLFQTMFVWQNTPEARLHLPGLAIELLEAPLDTAQFDLTLSLRPSGDRIIGALSYATALYDRDTIERYVRCWQTLLEALVADATTSPLHIPILPSKQRRQIVTSFNATQETYGEDASIHELIEAQTRRAPDAIALLDEQEQVSYGELDRRANRLAHYLREQGVAPGSRVAICVERGVPLLVCVLASLKAGAAYVPLDTEYPAQRLLYMLSDSAACVLLRSAKVSLSAEPSLTQIVIEDEQRWSHYPSTNVPATGHSPSHLAYVIYTSGSTGTPKGAMNEHRAVVNRLRWMQQAYALRADERVLQKTPFSFDVSVWELFWPLLVGAKLVLARPGGQRDPGYLQALIEQEQVSTTHFVPSMLTAFVEETSGKCCSLRRVVCSGEALTGALAQRVVTQYPHVTLYNLYGPTEAAVDVSAHAFHAGSEASLVPIGRPIANTQLYVLDEYGEIVPIGVSGEIHIGGVAVGRGYWRRAQLTAERFIPDAHGGSSGGRLYRTGDLGRYRSDGTLEYQGRNDEQVKIRGYRIECGEIAQQLSTHAQIQAAVVIAREEEGAEKRLVAYFTTHSPSVPSVEELRAYLSDRLPQYMVPAAYVHLETLPTTANGKLGKRALPVPPSSAYSHREYEAPRGEIEVALAEIWQRLLPVQRVGRHDNFFELGGHSLLATQFVSRVRKSLGRELTLQSVFLTPTIAALAHELASAELISLTDIPRADRSQPLPAARKQQVIWHWETTRPWKVPLMYCSGLRLRGALDRPALVAALDTMMERHEILRTGFQFDSASNQLMQCIAPQMRFPLREFDLSDEPPERRDEKVFELYRVMGTDSFELSVGPLIRACLIRLEESLHVFIMGMHYMICDAWSLEVLIREATSLYGAYRSGGANPLPPLPIQFADYALWQRRRLQGETLQRHVAYYKDLLEGAPRSLTLPRDHAPPDPPSNVEGIELAHCAPSLSVGLTRLARQHDVSLFMVLLAAYALMLTRMSKQSEVLIGAQTGNRQRPELESLIGPFASGIVIRLPIDDRLPVTEYLRRVRDATLAAQSHEALPGAVLNELLQAQGQSVNAVIRMQNEPRAMLQLDGLTIEPQNDGPGGRQSMAQHDVSLMVGESPGMIPMTLHYKMDLFEPETVAAWRWRLHAILEAMVRNPSQTLGALSS